MAVPTTRRAAIGRLTQPANAANPERDSADRTSGGGDSRQEPTVGRQRTDIGPEPRNLIVQLMPTSGHFTFVRRCLRLSKTFWKFLTVHMRPPFPAF